jgi:hypothetical protein
MSILTKAIFSASALVVLIISLPLILYAVGLSNVQGRPIAADPSQYTQIDLAKKWSQCSEKSPLFLEPVNPWQATYDLYKADFYSARPGHRASWIVAKAHNVKHRKGGMAEWHLSGIALTIWVSRNWTAEQLSATALRDDLCK